MRRIAHTLAAAGAIAGMGLTAIPAGASTLVAGHAAGQARHAHAAPALTPAQRQAAARAARLLALRRRHGVITGILRAPGGAPEANVCVVASGPLATRKTFTKPDGRYIIANLPRGAYRVEFRGCSPIGKFTGQWYGGLTRASAAKVNVTGMSPTELAPVTLAMISPRFLHGAAPARPGSRLSPEQRRGAMISRLASGRVITLPAGTPGVGHISGRVTSGSGHPVGRVCVGVAPPHGGFFQAATGTSADGRYRVRVRPGAYYVVFLPTCNRNVNLAPQLWKAAAATGNATLLHVKAGEKIVHIDAALRVGAVIAGRVTSQAKSHPTLGGLCMVALGTAGQRLFEGTVVTRADGTFRMPSLATGRYRLIMDPACSHPSDWLRAVRRAPVPVTDGKTTAGITLPLKLGGSISGVVKDPNGAKLAGICVTAFSADSFSVAQTAADGTYQMRGLVAGSYQMIFQTGCGNRGPYAPTALPSQVRVRPGVDTPHVNAVMAFDGTLSGVVRNAHGQPLGGICVVAQTSGLGFAFARTRPDGSYTAKRVPPGNYQVQFVPGGVFSDCGNNGNYLPATTSATVTSNATSTADGVLPTGGTISGVVTDGHGQPVAGVCAFSSSAFGGVSATGSDGSYQLSQLFSGSYFVGFEGGCGNKPSVAPVAYRKDPTFFGPASVPVTAGQVASGIDVRVRPGATITGTVTDQSGKPVSSVCVFVLGASGAAGNQNFNALAIDKHGSYAAANLPPGQYMVIFTGQFSRTRGCGPSPYADQELSGRGLGATPDLVYAAGGAVTGGVNAALSLAGKISGVVLNKAGKPVPGICVTAANPRTGAGTEVFSGPKGQYTMTELPAGRYAVEFSSCGGDFAFLGQTGLNYANQWYKGRLTASSADPVAVSPQRTTTGINAALTKGGLISGQVRYQPTQRPVSFVCVFAYTPNFSTVSFGVTDRRGRYLVDGLSTGRYIMEFDPCSGGSALAGQIRSGRLAIVAGRSVHGVNVQLGLSGSVSGAVSVRLPGGTPRAPGACIEAIPVSGNGSAVQTFTFQRGRYLATNLAPGSYEIIAGNPACSSAAPSLSAGASAPVQVTAGKTAGADLTLSTAGAISGVVRGPGGRPVQGICAEAYPVVNSLTTSPGIPLGVTAAGGSYRIGDLQPNSYLVRFTVGCGASGFATRWYKNAKTVTGAALVRVHAAAETTGINVTLPRS